MCACVLYALAKSVGTENVSLCHCGTTQRGLHINRKRHDLVESLASKFLKIMTLTHSPHDARLGTGQQHVRLGLMHGIRHAVVGNPV